MIASDSVEKSANSQSSSRQWWSQQWLDLINSYRFKKRLERGWRYARQGNVLSIRFRKQRVLSTVQGTEPSPYRLSLWLDPFTDEDWDLVITTLSQKAVFSAKLLAGEMPANIEEVFAANGLRLFPFSLSDVHSRCSCPDKANPCKHISAVYYLLGDRFSEDPFLLFQLRGRSREQVLEAIRHKRQSQAKQLVSTPETTTPGPNLENFWRYDEPLESSLVVIAPSGGETVLDILDTIPLAGATNDESGKSTAAMTMAYLREVYASVSQQAMLKAMMQANTEA
ncbi:MAG: hypothetical protein HC857_14175 [Synechococcales cyanobacterium RU_4_20]|nr:hypothetical protein [Synechococcales cyanobacterium RU_4_20]NJR70089.1 hypothetical protein [Synechococcales cyanobacterium CRU_2_2]